MDKTKFFTEQVTSGSRGEASDEDMQRRITDFGAEKMPHDSTFFMPTQTPPLYEVDAKGRYLFVRRATRQEILDLASHILENRIASQ